MSFLWPSRIKPEPSFLGRVGRVIHWCLTATAVLLAILGSLQLWSAVGLLESPDGEQLLEMAIWYEQQGVRWLGVALLTFVAGRVFRYILSGE